MPETTTPTTRETLRETRAELERFYTIAEGLGCDREEAGRRATRIGDERLDLDNAAVLLLALHDIARSARS